MGVTINNESTATDHRLGTDSSQSHWGLNAFYWYQIFTLDSAVVEEQKFQLACLSIAMYYHKKSAVNDCGIS